MLGHVHVFKHLSIGQTQYWSVFCYLMPNEHDPGDVQSLPLHSCAVCGCCCPFHQCPTDLIVTHLLSHSALGHLSLPQLPQTMALVNGPLFNLAWLVTIPQNPIGEMECSFFTSPSCIMTNLITYLSLSWSRSLSLLSLCNLKL